MRSYGVGFLVAGSGLIIALALWVVGYFVLPNDDTHRHLSQNQAIQTSAMNDSGSGSTTPGTSGGGSSTAANQAWYSLDKAAKTVDFAITAGDSSVESGMNFNDYNNGQLVVTVPVGWKVKIAFKNLDSSMPHSVGFVSWANHLNANAPAAFAGSIGPDFNSGMTSSSGTKSFAFTASKPGRYGMICGVPGHASAGMWDEFDVSSNAKSPSIQTPKGTVAVR